MDQHNPIDYRLLVDNLTTAILLIDSNFNIFYLNSACEALFDISLLRACVLTCDSVSRGLLFFYWCQLHLNN